MAKPVMEQAAVTMASEHEQIKAMLVGVIADRAGNLRTLRDLETQPGARGRRERLPDELEDPFRALGTC
jgi:hypothetical protein